MPMSFRLAPAGRRRRARPPAQLNYSTNYELQYDVLVLRTTNYVLRTYYVLRYTTTTLRGLTYAMPLIRPLPTAEALIPMG